MDCKKKKEGPLECIMDFTTDSSRCRACGRRGYLCSLSPFFTDKKTVTPMVFNLAIAKKYHYEAIQAREEDEDADIPLQPPKVPAEWREALLRAELPGTGKKAPKRFHIINNETYKSIADGSAHNPPPPPARILKRLPKTKALPPAPAPAPTPAPRTAPPAPRTAPSARASFGPAPPKATRSSTRQAGKSKVGKPCKSFFCFISSKVNHASMSADVILQPVSAIKSRNPRAFRPPGPPPALSDIRGPQTSGKGPKGKAPYKEIDETSPQDEVGGEFPDLDQGK